MPKQADGAEKKPYNSHQKIGKKISNLEHEWAEQGEIYHGAQKKSKGQVEADLPPFGHLCIEKQQQGGGQPEQQIQKDSQLPGGDAAAEDAKQIIKQADPHPQPQSGGQREGLRLHRNGHERKKRLKKPPERSLSS